MAHSSWLSDVPAGIDDDVVAGDVARAVGDQIGDGRGHIGVLDEAAERRLAGEVLEDARNGCLCIALSLCGRL